MAWEIMGTDHLKAGPYCNGGCVNPTDLGSVGFLIAYPHPDCELHGDPGLVNMDYQVGFGGAEHHDVLLSHSTARSEGLMPSSPTSSAVRCEA